MHDNEGLIVAYLLDGTGSGKGVGWDAVERWAPDQGLLWVHLDYTADRSIQWLTSESGLDEISSKIMLLDESRPRSVINDTSLLMILRAVNLNPGQDPEDMVSIRVWIDQHRIITTRRRRLLSIDDMRSAIDNGRGPKSSTEFMIMLNDRLMNRMSDVLEDIDDQTDALEQDVVTTESHLLRPKIAEIRRQSIAIRRYLAPQREALNRVYHEPASLVTTADRIYLREATDRITRYIEDLDSARDRATVSQEELSSRLSEQVDRRMYVLSLVAVIFLPLSFITGLLGINVGGIPGANYRWGFLAVCGILTALILLTLWIFHKQKWL